MKKVDESVWFSCEGRSSDFKYKLLNRLEKLTRHHYEWAESFGEVSDAVIMGIKKNRVVTSRSNTGDYWGCRRIVKGESLLNELGEL